MHWKQQLKNLELENKWGNAIELLLQVIKENPEDMDIYIFMNYLLMNLLVEEDYDDSKYDYYATLIKWCFDESYAKFSHNAEYLYLTAKTAVMSEWLFGISVKDYQQMIERAKQLDPDNLIYKEDYYWELYRKDPENPKLIAYIKIISSENYPIKAQLKTKGSLGEYVLGLKENWAKNILKNRSLSQNA